MENSDNLISVSNLTKKFKKFTAVDHISFDVKKGEIFGFLGPNGAGKSTTIRMLVTLLSPTEGEAKVAGFDIVKQQDEVRSRIGLVAEKVILYNHLTADENLEFFGALYNLPKKTIDERAGKWIDRLHMSDWRKSLVGNFSTGMKQRINIVRALLTEPEVLFLDEPTLGLDPQTTHVIRSFLQELNKQGVTIVLTTHDMVEAEALSNRVAIVDHGKIAAIDTVTNLFALVPEIQKPTLQDVFLKVTGEAIRDTASAKMPPTMRGRMMR